MPRKHKCPEPEEDNSKAWLDSYADAMTLLLAFFILLFAFSLVDQKKFQEFRAGLHLASGKAAPTIDGGDGILNLGTGISNLVVSPPVLVDGEKADIPPEQQEEQEEVDEELTGQVGEGDAPELYEQLVEQIEQIGASDFVELERSDRGVVVRMDAQVLYESGSAQILPDGVTILDSLQPILEAVDNMIVVEGHTDSQPTNGGGGYATNWELSTARAVSVLRYMNEFMGLPGIRLSATGYSDTRPQVSNETPEDRATNRRVELVVLIDEDELDIIGAGLDGVVAPSADETDSPPTGEDRRGAGEATDGSETSDEVVEPPLIDITPDLGGPAL